MTTIIRIGEDSTPAVVTQFEEEAQVATSQTQRLFLSSIVEVLVNFAFYSCAFPFKFNYKGQFSRATNCFQQFVVALLHTLAGIQVFAFVRESFPRKKNIFKFPSLYIDFTFLVCNCTYFAVCIKRVWWNNQEYLDVLWFLNNKQILPVKNSWVTNSVVLYAYCWHIVIEMGGSLCTGYELITPISDFSFSLLFRHLVAVGRYNFFITSHYNMTDVPEWSSMNWVDYCLGVAAGLGKFSGFALIEYFYSLMLACMLLLWVVSNAFATNIKGIRNDSANWDVVYMQFQSIKEFSDVVNRAFGTQVMWYLVANATGYAITIDVLFASDNHVSKFYTLHSLLNCCVFLYVAGDIRNNIDEAEAYLLKQELGSIRQVQNVFQDAQRGHVGIRPAGIFTMTKGFVGSYILVICSFFFFVTQDAMTRIM